MNLYNRDIIERIFLLYMKTVDEISACQVAVILRLDETLKSLFDIQRISLDEVARRGFVELLAFLCRHKYDTPRVSMDAIHDVCSNGHVHILHYLHESGVGFRYSRKAMGNATKHDRIAVLDWFVDSTLDLKYCQNVIGRAASRGKTAAVQWWLNSGLPVKVPQICHEKF